METNNFDPTENDMDQSQYIDNEYNDFLKNRMSSSETFDHWQQNIPHLIFKYRALDSALELVRATDIFVNYRLFMPTSDNLNDPFEGGNVDFSSSSFSERIKKCKILSLSYDCFSPPLWAHYASECSGICIGFSTYSSFQDIKEIRYSDTIDKKQWFSSDENDAIKHEFLYKNTSWNYESEYRIISEKDEEYFQFNKSEIAVVIFGNKINPDIKNFFLQFIPNTCYKFDIKSDKNRSRYYIEQCDIDDSPIYELEELYQKVIK